MFDFFKRVASCLARSGAPQREAALTSMPARRGTSALPEIAWHGDHWTNLLSSPMDARHYVLEEWAIPVSLRASEI